MPLPLMDVALKVHGLALGYRRAEVAEVLSVRKSLGVSEGEEDAASIAGVNHMYSGVVDGDHLLCHVEVPGFRHVAVHVR